MASDDEARGDGATTARTTAAEVSEPLEGVIAFGREVSVGRVLGGRYEITAHLGAGGMGIVFAARDRLLEMAVALKFVRPDLARDPREQSRLWKEVRLAQGITHPNVVRTFTLEREDGHLFIVMELLDGCSLAGRLREGPVPVAEAVRIARCVLTGLAAAHDRNIIHRDIKPENTRLCSDGRVVLMDFGIARAYQAEPAGADVRTGDAAGLHTALAGTAGYIAPEVAAGARATVASDLYAVGVVWREMLAGAPLPPRAAPVLARLLVADPARRFASAREVIGALDAAERPPSQALATWRRGRVVAGGLAVAIAVAFAIIGRAEDTAAPGAGPTFSALTDPGHRWWPHPTIPVCWEADKVGDELSWIHEAVRGPGSWPSHAGVDLIGWRECQPASTGIRITAAATMMAHTGTGRPPDGVARIEIDVGPAPERRWARCVAAGLDRKGCIQAETRHLVGRALGFAPAPDGSPRRSCAAPTTARDTRSIAADCGAASILQPLDLAASQAVYGVKDDVERGNLALEWDATRRPQLVAYLIDRAGQLQLARPSASRDDWQWTAAGGPLGWSGRFSVVSVVGDGGRRRLRGFGISGGRLYEHDATGAAAVWRERGGPGDLIGSATAVTYVDPAGRSRVHVFATSAAGHLHEYTDAEAGGGWHDRGGAGLAGSPTAISHLDDDGRRVVDTFVRDDRGALQQLRAVEGAPGWIDRSHAHEGAPVRHVGAPSVTGYLNGGGRRQLIVPILDEQRGLWYLWTAGGERWIWDLHRGGPDNLVGDPAYVRTVHEDGSSRFNVFAVGADGHLHQEVALGKWFFLDEGGPGNLVAGAGALGYYDADETSRTDVVVVTADGRGNHLAWTPSTTRWTAMGGPALSPIRR